MIWKVKRTDEFRREDLEYCFSLMAPERKEAILAICRAGRQKEAICGEWLARQMLAEQLGCPPQTLQFGRTEKGKPYLLKGGPQFNFSHSEGFIACAVGDRPLGIDIETRVPANMRVALRFCTAEEQQFLFDDPAETQLRFYKVWTAKEAYFKAVGSGITDLKSVCYFDLLPHLQQVITEDYVLSIYQE